MIPLAPTFAACVGAMLLWYGACRALERPPPPGDAPALARVRRARAWFLTLPISFYFGFVVGPVWAVRLLAALHAGAPAVFSFLSTESDVGRSAAVAMVTFMVLDLAVGVLEYREQIQVSTGWAHHFLYTVLYCELLRRGGTQFVIAGACCEMPTFIMALGVVVPAQRRDMAFGVTFFFTRIVWFVLLLCVYAVPAYNELVPPVLFVPPLVAAIAMHCWWWRGWLVGQGRRAAGRKGATKAGLD